jgi:NAD(P)-dependent dehydrogenase (short-subunit alcohol dehydrogenase family)
VRTVAHTAGVSPVNGSVEAIIAVDLVGTAFVLEAFGPVMTAGGSGVVIASMAAAMFPPLEPTFDRTLATTPAADLAAYVATEIDQFANPGLAYAIAKQANIARVAAAATSWGERGATINAISPGVISTVMGRDELAGENGEVMRLLIDGSATKRVGTPEDIAAAAEFLLSPSASFVTGTNLLVDGGVCASIRFAG